MDKYDIAIKNLTEDPSKIFDAWNLEDEHNMCLFRYASKNDPSLSSQIGCLTQIRRDPSFCAQTKELTEEIRADKRIPTRKEDITPENLHVFAEWQRRLDKELNRD